MKNIKNNNKGGRMRLLLFTVLLLIVSIICFYENYKIESDYTEEEKVNSRTNDSGNYKAIDAVNLVYINDVEVETEDKNKFSESDEYLLKKIAMAEAGCESTEGKALVMLVVLNRVSDKRFPDNIHDVIFQKNQFSPTQNGMFEKAEPDDDCTKALELIYSGWDNSNGALYFESFKNANNWHSRNLELLFAYGGHRFYK